jgi:hypothetical protein
MSEEASWNPVSGCFQCPINMDLRQSWAGINPLPCFQDIGRGYFSVPLETSYIPLLFSESELFGERRGYPGGNSGIGEVDNAQVDKFLAIGAHENNHINLSVFPVKGLIHLAAGKGYQALFDIISGSNNSAWENLQQWNLVIMKLIKSIAFVEELIATLLGCVKFRELDSDQSHKGKADSIEEVFVREHSALFGPDFERSYRQLAAIYDKFGIKPIQILTYYSMDWLEVEYFGTTVGVAFQKSDEETTRARLNRCLEIFSNVRKRPAAQDWTEDNWFDFFERWLGDFRRWRGGRQDLDDFVGYNLTLLQTWWTDRGFKDTDNPALTASWIRNVPKRSLMIVPKYMSSTMIKEDIPPMDTADPQYQQKLQRLNEQIKRAIDQNRTLVAIKTEPNTTTVIFLPLFDKDKQGAIPFAYLMTGERPSQSKTELIQYDLTAREFLSPLLFFEGLRVMVATGSGVRCPVRSMEWAERALARMGGNKLPPCCGRNKELIAFWEAGNKAKESGLFLPHTWERPSECM